MDTLGDIGTERDVTTLPWGYSTALWLTLHKL